ncbi:MAG: hypothetical protein V1736_03295 [Pseudomonadota bacterium]
MKKEFIRLVGIMALTVLLALILAACGGGGETGGGGGTSTSTGGGTGTQTTVYMSTISGSVRDGLTEQAIDGVSVKVYQDGSVVKSGTTDRSGIFMLIVPATQNGDQRLSEGHRVEFSKEGYVTVVQNDVDVLAGPATYLEPVYMVVPGIGNVSGTITHAMTGLGVSGLTMNLRKDINVKTGPVIAKTTTGSDGSYSIQKLDADDYTAEVSGEGYITMYFTIRCVGGQSIPGQDATITPIMEDAEIRIILSWNNALDLDAHMTGPYPNRNDRFHVYWQNKEFKYGGVHCKLDLDDKDGLGPETMTIYEQADGRYTFSVMDNSSDAKSKPFALSNSGAHIDVYQGSTLIRPFNIPANREGIQWVVFQMTIGPTGTTITTLDLVLPSTDTADL